MKKYYITYRNEFFVEVLANSKEEAKKKAIVSKNWKLINDIWDEYLKIEEYKE